MSQISSCFVVLICLNVWLAGSPCYGKSEHRYLPDLDDVLDALHRIMMFYFDRYELMNLDAMFGVRTAQGEMIRALEKAKTGEYALLNKNPAAKRKMKEIIDIGNKIGKLFIPLLKKRNPTYYEIFRVAVDGPYTMYELPSHKILKFYKNLLPKLPTKGLKSKLKEQLSDACVSELTTHGCNVDACWDQMTKMRTKWYYTTHQVLWLQFGIHAGCKRKLEAKAKQKFGSLNNLFEILCSSVVYQMRTLFNRGITTSKERDIFMEQGGICGTVGFADATNVTWLERVLSWQDPETGCYKSHSVQKQNGTGLQETRGRDNDGGSWRSRKLFNDVLMGDDCSGHSTSTAACFLSAHIRLFLDPVYRSNQLLPALRKVAERT